MSNWVLYLAGAVWSSNKGSQKSNRGQARTINSLARYFESLWENEGYEKNRNTEANRELSDVSLEVEDEDYQEDGNDKTETLIYNLDVVHQVGAEEIILLSSNGKVQYRCGNCSLTILLKEDLLEHFQTFHKDKK